MRESELTFLGARRVAELEQRGPAAIRRAKAARADIVGWLAAWGDADVLAWVAALPPTHHRNTLASQVRQTIARRAEREKAALDAARAAAYVPPPAPIPLPPRRSPVIPTPAPTPDREAELAAIEAAVRDGQVKRAPKRPPPPDGARPAFTWRT